MAARGVSLSCGAAGALRLGLHATSRHALPSLQGKRVQLRVCMRADREAYQIDKHSARLLCLCGLVIFFVGKLPGALQHVQYQLMYNPKHMCAHMLLLQVKDVE